MKEPHALTKSITGPGVSGMISVYYYLHAALHWSHIKSVFCKDDPRAATPRRWNPTHSCLRINCSNLIELDHSIFKARRHNSDMRRYTAYALGRGQIGQIGSTRLCWNIIFAHCNRLSSFNDVKGGVKKFVSQDTLYSEGKRLKQNQLGLKLQTTEDDNIGKYNSKDIF